MGLTITARPDGQDVFGKTRSRLFDITLDNNYPTNGYPVTAAQFGLRTIEGMDFIGGNAAGAVLKYAFDTTNSKIIALTPTGGSVAAALSDPSIGAGTLAIPAGATPVMSSSAQPTVSGAGALTAGQAKEVLNGSNLSTVVIRARVYGN